MSTESAEVLTLKILPSGGNHDLNSRVPDLSERFLMGAKDGGYGFNGGSASHSHTIVKEDPHAEGPQSFLAGDRSAVIQPNSNIPPFYTVIYIIKL